MPELPRHKTASELFGSCADIAEATVDDLSVVDTFPPESWFADDADSLPPQPPATPPNATWWAVGGVAAGLVVLSALFWGCWCKTVKDHHWCEPKDSSSSSSIRSSASQAAYTQVGYGSVEMPPVHETTRATTPQGI
jgi:hypothetical protein